MPDYSRNTVFILTPLIFRYHLPLKGCHLPEAEFMNSASLYTLFSPLFLGLTTNFVNPGYPNLDQMKGKGFPIFLNTTV